MFENDSESMDGVEVTRLMAEALSDGSRDFAVSALLALRDAGGERLLSSDSVLMGLYIRLLHIVVGDDPTALLSTLLSRKGRALRDIGGRVSRAV